MKQCRQALEYKSGCCIEFMSPEGAIPDAAVNAPKEDNSIPRVILMCGRAKDRARAIVYVHILELLGLAKNRSYKQILAALTNASDFVPDEAVATKKEVEVRRKNFNFDCWRGQFQDVVDVFKTSIISFNESFHRSSYSHNQPQLYPSPKKSSP